MRFYKNDSIFSLAVVDVLWSLVIIFNKLPGVSMGTFDLPKGNEISGVRSTTEIALKDLHSFGSNPMKNLAPTY